MFTKVPSSPLSTMQPLCKGLVLRALTIGRSRRVVKDGFALTQDSCDLPMHLVMFGIVCIFCFDGCPRDYFPAAKDSPVLDKYPCEASSISSMAWMSHTCCSFRKTSCKNIGLLNAINSFSIRGYVYIFSIKMDESPSQQPDWSSHVVQWSQTTNAMMHLTSKKSNIVV